MEFAHDLFISYAHDDDKTPYKDHTGWVKALDESLTIRLNQLFRANPSIWRDAKKLRGTDAFAGILDETVTRACVLVSILSPNYVGSDWCLRELETFWDNAERTGSLTLRGSGKCRAVKLEKTPFKSAEVVPAKRRVVERFTGEVLGYRFWVEDEEAGGQVRELDPNYAPLRLDFERRVDDLAYGIKELLELARGKPARGAEKPAVFLAETTGDLDEWRDEIRRDLERKEYRVFPDRPLPTKAEPLQRFLQEQLEQCRVAVHPVGKKVGFIPEGATQSAVELQIELARARAAEADSALVQLIWIPEGLETVDVEQEQWKRIEQLRDDPRLREGGDLIERSLEELKTTLYEKLAALEAKRAVVYVAASTFGLRKQRGALIEELESRGYTVLPEWEPPLLASDLEARVRKDLARSHVFLHLAGPDYGVVPEGTDRSIAHFEYALAVEREADGPHRLLVLPPGLAASDERQRGFVDQLRSDAAATPLQTSPDDVETLKTAVAAQVASVEQQLARPAAPQPAAAPDAAAPVRVYVISDQGDEGDEQLARLKELLRERRYEVLTPFFAAEDEQERDEEHEENLKDCHAVLVYHGAANERWQRRRLRELRRLPELPRHARAVVLAPPRTPPKAEFGTEEAEVIDATGGISAALFRPFLDGLAPGRQPAS